MNKGHNARVSKRYQEIQRVTESVEPEPKRLIQLLLNGLIECLEEAQAAADEQEPKTMAVLDLERALRLVDELRSCLQVEAQKSMAEEVKAFCDFVQYRLENALKPDHDGSLIEVIELVSMIRDGHKGGDPSKEHFNRPPIVSSKG
jgi:flagellar secretion chaperone FliS